MYLLYCKNCGEVYSPKATKEIECGCGVTSGILEGDKVKINGDPFVLNVDDTDLGNAIFAQQQNPANMPVNTILLANTNENVIT